MKKYIISVLFIPILLFAALREPKSLYDTIFEKLTIKDLPRLVEAQQFDVPKKTANFVSKVCFLNVQLNSPNPITLEDLALDRHSHGVYSIAFSPDGTTFASASDHTAKLWDA